MDIRYGTTRLVIRFPFMGLVIKLPIIKLFDFFKELSESVWYLQGDLLRGQSWSYLWYRFSVNARHTLLRGFLHNWREYSVWKRTRSLFLQPTFFSLYGMVNIQRYGAELTLSYKSLRSQLRRITRQDCLPNGHHFSNPRNFSVSNGLLKMVDYGGPDLEEVISKYGERISAQFDVTK